MTHVTQKILDHPTREAHTDYMTSTETPAQIDAKIAAALHALVTAQVRYESALSMLKYAHTDYYRERAQAEIDAALTIALAASETYNVESARYAGWSRFYLVLNSNGHIHRDTHCTTCFSTTRYAWLTELSGQTEAEAVAEYGAQLCTVCFPSAPVEWTDGSTRGRLAQAARDARVEAKAAREAAKLAKSITAPGGEPLRIVDLGSRPELIETLAAAKQRATDAAEDLANLVTHGHTYQDDAHVARLTDLYTLRLAQLTDAIAHKCGTTAEAEAEAARGRAAKRIKAYSRR